MYGHHGTTVMCVEQQVTANTPGASHLQWCSMNGSPHSWIIQPQLGFTAQATAAGQLADMEQVMSTVSNHDQRQHRWQP